MRSANTVYSGFCVAAKAGTMTVDVIALQAESGLPHLLGIFANEHFPG